MFRWIPWGWEFLLFLLRGTMVAITDLFILYTRTGKVWLCRRDRVPTLIRGDLVVQLDSSSPCHSKTDARNVYLHWNPNFIDRRLWIGIDAAASCPLALVTGVSYGGIGFYTALYLLLSGFNVYGVTRTAEEARQAGKFMREATNRQVILHKELAGRVGHFTIHTCDLSDTVAVVNLADLMVAVLPSLRIIVCNAGPMCTPLKLSPQGLEEQFATHHVGHSLLVLRLLQSRLNEAASRPSTVASISPLRIVVVASAAAATATPSSRTTFHEWSSQEQLERNLSRFSSYGNAKMCQLLFAFALARYVHRHRLLSSLCTVNAVHPGPIRSRVMENSQLPFQSVLDGDLSALFRLSPVIGALYVADIALSRRHEGVNGHFFRMGEDESIAYHDMVHDARLRTGLFRNSTLFPGIPGPVVSLSMEKQEKLWNMTLNYFWMKGLVSSQHFVSR